jgi:hypothetical protein
MQKTLKRRSFFTAAVAAVAALPIVPPLLKNLLRLPTGAMDGGSRITVRLNPLAIPRSKKGTDANG